MAKLMFGGRLREIFAQQATSTGQSTLRLALEDLFLERPLLRSYLLNDQGILRRGLWVFINGSRMKHTQALDSPLTTHATVFLREAPGASYVCTLDL
jgi:molybdopterin synthase sulfur carrier subunit